MIRGEKLAQSPGITKNAIPLSRICLKTIEKLRRSLSVSYLISVRHFCLLVRCHCSCGIPPLSIIESVTLQFLGPKQDTQAKTAQ